ncbi:hypothetical protein CWB99_03305 [Pseudoalteromonas rubra]|uniref:Uncharacterized protein n=1 Tax=Pseudoalteromonas rubra TaxID=43658 RepID=A0A5S3WSY5_9GAMM|nr:MULTISPECIES: hypothetical protein [Pseudoalteromonas]MCO7187823.1 hypothetical protein [Pseudoalteromonas sp. XMcav2-N]TMP30130.1 hypothetical protein CWC00_17180 [Pseudoalteromonas rubra]TMP32003.1 hypothetical protein CWB99_03305 [Pseudoalteromonas rubra]
MFSIESAPQSEQKGRLVSNMMEPTYSRLVSSICRRVFTEQSPVMPLVVEQLCKRRVFLQPLFAGVGDGTVRATQLNSALQCEIELVVSKVMSQCDMPRHELIRQTNTTMFELARQAI